MVKVGETRSFHAKSLNVGTVVRRVGGAAHEADARPTSRRG